MSPNPPLPSQRRRVAIYTRASDDAGHHRQREDVERHVSQHSDWAVVAVYKEVERPDKKRPALDELLADAKNGALDLIAVRDMARLGRSMQDFARIVGPLKYYGVDIVTAVEEVDTSTPEGRLMMLVVTSFVGSFTEAQLRVSRGVR